MKRILLTIGLFLCCSAYAGEFTMLLGDSHFTPQSDGTWWQQPFPHDLKMNSPSLGLRYDTVQNDEGWSFGDFGCHAKNHRARIHWRTEGADLRTPVFVCHNES